MGSSTGSSLLKVEKGSTIVLDILFAVAIGVIFFIMVIAQLQLIIFILNNFSITLIDGIYYYNDLDNGGYIYLFCEGCILLLCGMITGYYHLKKGLDTDWIIVSGYIEGLIVGLLLMFIIMMTSHSLGTNADYWLLTIAVAGLLIACMTVVASGAYLFAIIARKARGYDKSKLMKSATVAMLVIIAIPQLFIMTGATAGAFKEHPVEYYVPVFVDRTAEDTITITVADNDAIALNHNVLVNTSWAEIKELLNKEHPFNIRLNGTDVSNFAVIRSSGIDVTIIPDTGLDLETGQKVTLKGPAVSAINKTEVTIALNLKNGYRIWAHRKV